MSSDTNIIISGRSINIPYEILENSTFLKSLCDNNNSKNISFNDLIYSYDTVQKTFEFITNYKEIKIVDKELCDILNCLDYFALDNIIKKICVDIKRNCNISEEFLDILHNIGKELDLLRVIDGKILIDIQNFTYHNRILMCKNFSSKIYITENSIWSRTHGLLWKYILPTLELLEKHYTNIIWDELSENTGLTLEIIDRYVDKFNWDKLSENSCITMEIIDKYTDKINWMRFSNDGRILTYDIIYKYHDKLSLSAVLRSNSYFLPGVDKIYEAEIFSHPQKNTIDKYIKDLIWSNYILYGQITIEIIEKNYDKVIWEVLSRNKYITYDIIDKYEDKIDWLMFSVYGTPTIEIIEKYHNRLYWVELLSNKNITVDIIEKYIDRLNNGRLSSNNNIPLEILEKYIGKNYWYNLSFNPNITPEFVNKYNNKIDKGFLLANYDLNKKYLCIYYEKLGLNQGIINYILHFL